MEIVFRDQVIDDRKILNMMVLGEVGYGNVKWVAWWAFVMTVMNNRK
jgi:hypothetical protein